MDWQLAHFVRVSSLLRVRRIEGSGGTPSSSSSSEAEAWASIPPALRAGPPSASEGSQGLGCAAMPSSTHETTAREIARQHLILCFLFGA